MKQVFDRMHCVEQVENCVLANHYWNCSRTKTENKQKIALFFKTNQQPQQLSWTFLHWFFQCVCVSCLCMLEHLHYSNFVLLFFSLLWFGFFFIYAVTSLNVSNVIVPLWSSMHTWCWAQQLFSLLTVACRVLFFFSLLFSRGVHSLMKYTHVSRLLDACVPRYSKF